MRTVVSVAVFLLMLAYPIAIYVGLTRLTARELAWPLLGLVVLMALARLGKPRAQRWSEALLPAAVMAALVALTGLLDDHRYLLATPVLINLVLLAGFAGSLRSERPLVERFARLQVEDLSPAEVAYCRSVTIVWSLFFVLNGTAAGLLAALSPLAWWALYTGLLSYVLMGALFAGEYLVRRARFGRFGDHPLDRLLRLLLARGSVHG